MNPTFLLPRKVVVVVALLFLLALGLSSLAGCAPAATPVPPTAAATTAPTQAAPTTAAATSAPSGAAKELVIGAIMPLSGPISPVGVVWGRGYQLFYEQLNAQGGLKIGGDTYKIKYVLEDGGYNAEKSATAATKLVSQDGAKFIFGEISDAAGAAIDKITTPAGVLHIITFTTPFNAVDVSKDKPLTARLMVSPYDTQALLLKALVAQYPNAKKVALVVPDLGYDRMLADLTKAITGQGLQVTYTKKFPVATSDFVPIYTDVLSKNPDVIWIVRSGQSPAEAKTATDLGFTGVLIDDTPRDPDVHISAVGDGLANMLVSGIDSADMNSDMQAVANAWKAEFKDPFATDALYAWDQASILTQAMQKAQSVDPAQVMKALEAMNTPGSVKSLFGDGQMVGNSWYGVPHALLRPIPVTQIVKGKKTFLGLQLAPSY